MLDYVISVSPPSPRQFAETLAIPLLDGLYETLMKQLAAGFMETWVRTLREQARASGEPNRCDIGLAWLGRLWIS
ncbi:hypothetical protein [Streptomyces sp. MA5143a]|uniref:hypothetical protein n=1 Tax=Streptomyces sp. MA5143a TaxID=2083010 RepID=UPI0011B21D81|nr:hypothetical protein [Streptomyces sp. MA5143a]